MQFLVKRIISGVALLTLVSSSTGCSYVGYKLGGAVDRHKADTKPVKTDKIEKIDPGTVIDVYTIDGQQLTGEFSLVDRDPDDETIEGIEFFQFFPEPPGMRRITLEQLDRVEVPNPKKTRYYFAAFGAMVDFVLVGVAVFALTQN